MADVFRSSVSRDALARPKASAWSVAAGIVAILCSGFLVTSTFWIFNGDTSWLITVIDRMHAGDRLYADIIELNPPIAVWLYMLPVQLSYATGISAEMLVRGYVLLICLLGMALTGWMLRDGGLLPKRAILPAFAALLTLAVTLSGNAFSERDHIGAVLLLPLIVLAAWRAQGRPDAPQSRHWLAAGLAGGVMTLVKPYYAVIVIAAAAYIAVRRGTWRAFLLPEFVIAGVMSIAYMAVFYAAYPVFFSELLPLLRETYLAFSWPFYSLLPIALPWLALPVAYWFLAGRGGRNELSDVFLLAGLVALIPYFIQGKRWAYHIYPATLLGSAAIVFAGCVLLLGREARGASVRRPVGIVSLAIFALFVAHVPFLPGDMSPRRLADSVRAEVKDPTVAALGGDIAVGHPLTRLIGGRWIEPYCSDWIGTYALRMAGEAQSRGDGERVRYYEAMLERHLAAKLVRLQAEPPDVLIVGGGDRLVKWMLSSFGFGPFLRQYEKIAADGDIRVYKRIGPAEPPAG